MIISVAREFWKVNISTFECSRIKLFLNQVVLVEEFSSSRIREEKEILDSIKAKYPTMITLDGSRVRIIVVELTNGHRIHILGALELFDG